jgi:hypothetical protein
MVTKYFRYRLITTGKLIASFLPRKNNILWDMGKEHCWLSWSKSCIQYRKATDQIFWPRYFISILLYVSALEVLIYTYITKL